MIKKVFTAITNSTRMLLSKWPSALLMLVFYAALIATVSLFFSTREATVGQVLLSFLLPPFALVLFFVLQTMAARFGVEEKATRLLASSLRKLLAVVLISVPLVLLAGLIIYLAGHVDASIKAPIQQAARNLPAKVRSAARPTVPPVPWQVTLTRTVEYVLLLVALPLAAVQLWLATARRGLKDALRSSGRLIARAFAPESVLVYAIGFVAFAVIPYLLLFTRTPANNAWVDAGLLGLRLFAAALLSLIGWVITVGAVGELRPDDRAAGELNQGAEHAPVAAA